MGNRERAEELIAGYCEGTLNEAETEELSELMDLYPEISDMFRAARQTEILIRTFNAPGKSEAAWNTIAAGISGRKKRGGRIALRVITSAAAVAAIFFVSYFIAVHPGERPDADDISSVMPGAAKATLVLPDGETIILGDEIAGIPAVTSDSIHMLIGTVVSTSDYNIINVPRGGYYTFKLPDGSDVYMNSETSIHFPGKFDKEERHVYVTGEVFFEVVRDDDKPFVVHSAGSTVRVLGTRFNVSAYPGEGRVVTTLVSGSVEFSANEYKDILKPGEQTIWGPESGIYLKRRVDTSLFTSWIEGNFLFEKAPMRDIAGQLTRWYDVDFIFESEELADYLFTGVSSRNRELSVILNAIAKTTDIDFELKENIVYVKKKNE